MGKEFSRQLPHFYKNLDEIWIMGRRKGLLISLIKESPVPCRIFDGDMLKSVVYEELKATLEWEKPDIRMLVNGAGFGKVGTVEEIEEKEPLMQLDMIDLNCRALTRMALLCLPYFTRGSRIINLASAAAFCPQPSLAVYAATKSYVLSFSKALGAELLHRGIYVTAVCPGPVNTEFFNVAGSLPNQFKNLAMAEADQVVHKALQDSRKRKSVSIYGPYIKAAGLGAKILPTSVAMKLEEMAGK